MKLRSVESDLPGGLNQKRIGIIGAGALGLAFAHAITRVGLEAVISNRRGGDSLADLVRPLGAGAIAATVQEAALEEIVLLAVPWSQLTEAVSAIADWEGRIVIDATNRLEGSAHAELETKASSEVVAQLVPGAYLVKAFNTLPHWLLAAPPEAAGGRRVIFFSGDHARAKAVIGRLIARMGFAGIDLGRLSEGGRLQQFPAGPLAGLDLFRMPTIPPAAAP